MKNKKKQIFRVWQRFNKPIHHFTLIIMMLLFLSTNILQAQSLWVGETYKCDATSAVMGLTSDVSWTTSGGYIQLSGSGFYRNAKVTQYFSGSATVKCSWKYRLYSGDSWKTMSRSWNISCKDNPASINPTSMTLASGETGYVGYSFSYSNSYTSNAEPYFSSSNPNVATVSTSGEVTAKNPGTAYITLYSKISKNSPYCTVRVTEKETSVKPTAVSLPSTKEINIGETVKLTPTLTPSNAIATFTWSSSKTSVATVTSTGTVKGVSKGTVTITVTTDNGKSASCRITVNDNSTSDDDDADLYDKLKRAKTRINALKSKSSKYLY